MSKGSRTRPLSVTRKTFNDNWDRIFGKKEKNMQVQANNDKIGSCGCGRSPTGKCIGWHGLNDQQLAEARKNWKEQTEKE
jgi:hypothetical protein